MKEKVAFRKNLFSTKMKIQFSEEFFFVDDVFYANFWEESLYLFIYLFIYSFTYSLFIVDS